MGKFFSFIKSHLNSWDEISLDETLRLRANVLMFTFIISCMCIGSSALIAVDYGITVAMPTIALVFVSIGLFFRQLLNPAYSFSTAWLFGVFGFAVAFFLVWTGGVDGTGPLWLCVLPIIATMGLPLRSSLIYNCILIVFILALLRTPLQNFAPYSYSIPFRVSIPVSLMFVIICNYATEIAWYNTHKKLVVASRKLQTSALTDPLTGAYNRRALELHFGGINEKRPGLAFAMLDLDFFKKVNDNYGHDVGDKALSHVVKITRENIPSDAHLYRWGGEEFLLVLKTSNPNELEKDLERLREKIENAPLVFAEGLHATINITVSIGGVYPNQDLTIGECINLADVHLYEAKEKGRNRVIV